MRWRGLLACGLMAGWGVCAAVAAADDLKAQMAREGRPALVLCVGGDWCVSGEKVRKTYTSPAFKSALGGRWLFGVRDQWEGPAPAAVSNENARVKSLETDTNRYPALFLFNKEGEPVGRLENLPHDITPSALARQVAAADAVRAAAEADFARGAYGEGFDRLKDQVPNLFRNDRKQGWLTRAYPQAWSALRAADPADKEGWLRHFTMGDGLADVEKANGLHEKPEEGRAFIAELRTRNPAHCTVVQKQSVDMAEFALIRRDAAQRARARTLLKQVFAAGPETFWGWAAYGYLTDKDFGETLPPPSTDRVREVKSGKGLVDRALNNRPAAATAPAPDAAAKLLAAQRQKLAPAFARRGVLSAEQETALARAWALHEIGVDAVQSVLRLEGGRAFTNAFLKDKAWLEDFLASGPLVDAPAAFTNLAALVWNDASGAILKGGLARTVATAMALQLPKDQSIEKLVRTFAGYMFLADVGRLHKSAYTQSVREWRFALGKILDIADLLYLNDYLNYQTDNYGGACWCVPYRLYNCFGESVQTPLYYRPWRDCTWPTQALRPTVGGVCGALSTFGALSANAHGLMASTGGQPGHCAYARRRNNGQWDIHNYVGRYTSMHNTFWNEHAFTYFDVFERSYANRARQLQADRLVWLAQLAEEDKAGASAVEGWYRLAVKANPKHYGAWRAYSDWLLRTEASDTTTQAYLKSLAQNLGDGRQATWDLVNRQVVRLGKGKDGPERAVATLERLYPLLPQPTNTPTREEMDIKRVLEAQAKLVGDDAALRGRLFKAALAAQVGRPAFAEVLGWGADWYLKDATRAKDFVRLVEAVGMRAAPRGGKGAKPKIDCRAMMANAAKAGDLAVFRTVADLFDRLNPVDPKAPRYPESDFGGKLLSAKGMLTTSSTSNWDKSELHGRVLDATKQPNPNDPNDLGTFHTGRETAPWAIVELPGDAQVTGVFLLNKFGQNAPRQVPLEVFVSTDGKTWTRVYETDKVQDEYRIAIPSARRARYVKVARTPDAKNEFFHFGKILVYGKRLY